MARDVASVARSLRAALLPGAVPDGRPVNAVLDFASFGPPVDALHATLVIAEEHAIVDADHDRLGALREAVVVTSADGPRLRSVLQAAGITAMVGAPTAPSLLGPTLTSLLAVDQAAEARAITSAMRVLTLAARRSGITGVIAELAHRIDGWAVLLDRHGEVITTAGAGSLHIDDAIAVAVGRPVRVRHRALQVHPVGPGQDISAQLVTAPRNDSSGRGRELSSQAAALLDLLMRTRDSSHLERLGRSMMFETVRHGGDEATRLLRRWGVHERVLRGFALASRTSGVDVEHLLALWLDELGAEHVFTSQRGVVHGVVREDHAEEIAHRARAFASTLYLGLGRPAGTDVLARSIDEARHACEAARTGGERVVRYEAIPTVSFVLGALDADQTGRLARLLDPLRGAERSAELLDTLRVFLASHGAWSESAARLRIHRQTLTARIRRIEDLLGLSLSDPDDRVAAWLALRAADG
ncbi:PucR family transcriptional regulator [Microbacterium sp. BLY]|uniref:PucR family transcriptional regulator n=1 Tax=Microbacterium sp. BLY TaxID=2823280 RepID=UPI001B31EBE0|nr:PucR family transcriptional regulator [Microbacterium sp. BLY]MBP3978616.1 helix-turn-helix domain-containing protein [Microbacterium sp. BLY]